MNDYQLLPVGGELLYTIDFAADVPATATVTGIVFSVDPVGSLSTAGQTNDLTRGRASIKVSGASHGVHYVLKAVATLDNGEDLVKVVSLVGFNG